VPKADLSWRGSQIHRDDILCLDHLLPISNLMCTASYDGEIHVWNIDAERLVVSLRRCIHPSSNRPASTYRRSSAYRATSSGPTPVDKLMFLRGRARVNIKSGLILYQSHHHE
jgi:WD40 repeat protein